MQHRDEMGITLTGEEREIARLQRNDGPPPLERAPLTAAQIRDMTARYSRREQHLRQNLPEDDAREWFPRQQPIRRAAPQYTPYAPVGDDNHQRMDWYDDYDETESEGYDTDMDA